VRLGLWTPCCAAATTNTWFSMARARSSTCQWSFPVGTVNAAGTTTMRAPAAARPSAMAEPSAPLPLDGPFPVEAQRRLGLEIVVTDHHRPGETFPACSVVAPLKGDYPFKGLCGTAVVWKLAEALLGPGHAFLDRHLDVVALATVADVVPLVDESRALALAGLRRLAQTQRPGLRALMAVAGVDPAACDEGAIGFRLAPRINASGRLCRPEAALVGVRYVGSNHGATQAPFVVAPTAPDWLLAGTGLVPGSSFGRYGIEIDARAQTSPTGTLLLASIPVFGRFFSMRSQQAGLERQVQTLIHENQQLAHQISRYKDPAYLEQLARECLGMVKPGEVRFSIPPAHAAPKPPAC